MKILCLKYNLNTTSLSSSSSSSMLSSLFSWRRRDHGHGHDHECDRRSKTSHCAYNRGKPPDDDNGDATSPSQADAPAPVLSPSESFSPVEAPTSRPPIPSPVDAPAAAHAPSQSSFAPPQEPPISQPSTPSPSPLEAPAPAPSQSFAPPQEPPVSQTSTPSPSPLPPPPLTSISMPPINELTPVIELPPSVPPLPPHATPVAPPPSFVYSPPLSPHASPVAPPPRFVYSAPPPPLLHMNPEEQENIATAVIAGISSGGSALLLGLVCFILVYLSRKCRRKKKSLDNQKPKGCHDQGNGLDHHQQQNINNDCPCPPNSHAILMLRKYAPGAQLSSGGYDSYSHNGSSGCSTPSLRAPRCTFSFEELELATNIFSDDNLLGEGGFGFVHKGVLSNGIEVAVKQLKIGSRQGEREFHAEVETITRVHHKHLVSLVGYCLRGCQRLLVYEYVPNNTLQFHLHGIGQPVMEWSTRMKIAAGAAKGLAYLHEDCELPLFQYE